MSVKLSKKKKMKNFSFLILVSLFTLPRVMKEEIFCWMGNTKDIASLGLVSKDFKNLVDKSEREELKEVRARREKYEEEKKRKQKEAKRREWENRTYKRVGDVSPRRDTSNDCKYFAGNASEFTLVESKPCGILVPVLKESNFGDNHLC